MAKFVLPRFLGFQTIQPQTVNVGASFGPRISTAGFEIYKFTMPVMRLRLYADLDGNLWQDDGDITRRGAHAVVPFAKRAVKALSEARADVETTTNPQRPGIRTITMFFSDEVEGFERRLQCTIDYRASDGDDVNAIQEGWVKQVIAHTNRMGADIHVAVHDPANSNIFQTSRKSA